MKKPEHILLIEDNLMDVELMLDAFREARVPNIIHVALNSQDALDYLFGWGKYADRQEYPLPILVLLDLKLLCIDGFEVLRQVKETPILKRLTVVIFTSLKEECDCALSYDIGANSYLVKPVSYEEFLDVVRQIDSYWLSINIAPTEMEIRYE